MARIRFSAAAFAALALVGLVACDETDAVAVRVHLQSDFSGRVTTSGLRVPEPAVPMEHLSEGVQWDSRVHLVCASGVFENLAELRIEDIAFGVGEAGELLDYVEVVLPRGPSAAWPRRFVPLSEEERQRAADTIDPSGGTPAVGKTVKFELELPGRVIGHGLSSRPHGAKEKVEGRVATLVVPLDSTLDDEESLVWHVTWRK